MSSISLSYWYWWRVWNPSQLGSRFLRSVESKCKLAIVMISVAQEIKAADVVISGVVKGTSPSKIAVRVVVRCD